MGAGPAPSTSFRAIRKYGTFVPSLLVANLCSTTTSLASKDAGREATSDVRSFASTWKRVTGRVRLSKVTSTSSRSSLAPTMATCPFSGRATVVVTNPFPFGRTRRSSPRTFASICTKIDFFPTSTPSIDSPSPGTSTSLTAPESRS